MDVFPQLFKAILIIVMLYALALLMKKNKVLNEDHSLVLARIVTDLFLPAIIFISLAKHSISLNMLAPAIEMLALEICMILIAWFISMKLNFSKEKQGAVVFCSAFGSSAFLGYPLIIQIFPNKPEALTEAVLISEIGVGYPIFILGPILASYFSSKENDKKAILSSSIGFFKTPVFAALVAGLLWGILKLPTENNLFTAPIFHLGHVLASALTPVAILSVGLIFKLPPVKKIIIPLLIVVLLKLILKPLAGGYFASLLGFPSLWKDIITILAAMPPAILGVVFLKRYGGDASLASALLLAASIISIGTLLGVFYLIG